MRHAAPLPRSHWTHFILSLICETRIPSIPSRPLPPSPCLPLPLPILVLAGIPYPPPSLANSPAPPPARPPPPPRLLDDVYLTCELDCSLHHTAAMVDYLEASAQVGAGRAGGGKGAGKGEARYSSVCVSYLCSVSRTQNNV